MIIKDTESVDVPTFTGHMRTYLFRPATEGRYPGLLLFSEIFQMTGPVRRAAAMLASHGFVVAVPEIYHEMEPAGPRVPILITPSPSFQPLTSCRVSPASRRFQIVLRPCILSERFTQTYWTYHLALPDGWMSHGDHLEHLTTIRRRTFKGVFLLMNIRFYIDPETVLPHIYGHRVDER